MPAMSIPGTGRPPVDPLGPGAPSPSAGRAPTDSRSAASPGSHLPTQILSGNWPTQAADAVVKGVDTVREKTTGPIQTAARGLVYGIVASVAGTMILILVIIGLVRFLDAIQPFGNIWLPYLELGLTFTLCGYLVFRRRRRVEL
jgi:hypothetical protein